MAHKDIEGMLDQLRRIKSRGDLNIVKIDEIEALEMELTFFRTFIKYHHVVSPDFFVKIAKKAKLIVEMLHSVSGGMLGEYKTLHNVERVVSEFHKFNFALSGSYLLQYMDYLGQNLNDAPRYLVRCDTLTDRYLQKMAHKDIEDMLDQLRRIKSRGDLNVVKIDEIETLERELAYFRTYQCRRVVSPDSLIRITKEAKLIVEMLHSVSGGILGEYKTLHDVERLVSGLQEFNFELNGSYLLQYMDYLDQNINDAPR